MIHQLSLLATTAISVLSYTSLAQPTLTESAKHVAPDAEEGDFFGSAVAAYNGTIAIGAPGFQEDPKKPVSGGSVYIIDSASGDVLQELTPLDAQERAKFGAAIALNDEYVVVGAPDDHCPNTSDDCGAVYIFDANTGTQLHKLTQEPGFGTIEFGYSVAIEENTVVVGVRRESNQNGSQAGGVYIFDAATGAQLHHFTSNDGIDDDTFGHAVSISSGRIAISAPNHDAADLNAGAVYIFDAQTAAQLDKLLPENPAPRMYFGESVAIDEDTVLIGATNPNINRPDTRGAYLHSLVTGQQTHELIPSNNDIDDRFGVSVALHGELALVGAWASDEAAFRGGAAYLFDTKTGLEVASLEASDALSSAANGHSVALSDNLAILGAPTDRSAGIDAGAAYSFIVSSDCAADLNDDNAVDFFDVSTFLNAYNASDPIADFDGNGSWDFFDVSLFLNAFNAGCP